MSLLIQDNLVSTIIPVFNRPDMIAECVDSVLAQTHRPIEIILIDDGSTDRTPEVLQMLANENPEVRVFTQANQGPGVARETGRINAKGEFIQYLDSDDLLLPDKFTLQIAALKHEPDCDVAYGKTERRSISVQGIRRAWKRTGEKHSAMFPLFLRSRWWGTSTPLYRRSCVDKAGRWLDTLNEEDWEYDCRIASLGGRLAYVDEFVSVQREHDEHLSADGSTDAKKLQHRCLAQAKIFRHAQRYMQLENRPSDIEDSDWEFYSKAAFLLARQCALQNLKTEARAMLRLSIEAIGRKTKQHRAFLFAVKWLGWQRAAKTVRALGK